MVVAIIGFGCARPYWMGHWYEPSRAQGM